MARLFDLVVLGEINVDLILTGDVTPGWGQHEKLIDDAQLVPGSSSAIFACGAARLGLRTAFVGVIGDDLFGAFMRDHLHAAGVNTHHLIVDPHVRTGITVHLSRRAPDGTAERALLTYAGSIAELRAEQVDPGLLSATRYVHTGSYFLQHALRPGLPALYAEARSAGAATSLDTGWDPAERWNGELQAVLAETDIFMPNEAEALRITGAADSGAALERLAESTGIVAIKRGAEGAIATYGAERASVRPPQLDVVDTTGAGDTFDAGFIAALARGLPLADALAVAVACGSLSTRGVGGTSAQPSWDEAWTVATELRGLD